MDFRFVWKRVRQFRGELLLLSTLTLLGSLATLSLPWLAGQLLGDLAQGSRVGLDQTIALLIGALVSLAALSIASAIVSARASLTILNRLREEVHAHVVSMPVEFHERRSTGDLIALTTYEVGNLSSFLASTLAQAPSMVLTAAGSIILLFVIDPAMAIIVPLLVPVFFVVVKLAGRELRALAQQARNAEVAVVSTAQTDLSMISAIKALATEENSRDRYRHVTAASRQVAFRQARISAFIAPIVGLLAALAAIAILIGASQSLVSEKGGQGDLFAFLLYAALLTRPVGSLADMYGRFQIARGTLARLQEVLEMDVEPGYRGGRSIERSKGRITLEKVRFGFPGRPRLFSGISLEIRPGETVALTGDNGVGKSTLVKLLLRFYDPESGRIALDGIDISEIRLQDLRRQFGYVPQRPLLFNGTIAENIVCGQLSEEAASREQALDRAIGLAQADDFIAKLPQGLATQIGDHGVRLSGGQGQRIALARALLRQPPVYILDEATSMYDRESEAAFVEDCVKALRGNTLLIITHRPATLALADRVLHVTREGISELKQ